MKEIQVGDKVLVPFFEHWSTAIYRGKDEKGNDLVSFDPASSGTVIAKDIRPFDLDLWHKPVK